MPVPVPREPGHPDRSRQLPSDTDHLRGRLYRPIVFRQPDRIVAPNSWLEHIPFAFWLVEAMRPSTLVELGTQSGNSYAAFAQAIKLLDLPTAAYAVDTWQGDSQAGFYGETVFTEWQEYHDHHFSAFSRLIRSTFDEAAEHFADGTIDLLHIDGCHSYEAVSADFARWRPKLSSSGVVLFHDTNVRERNFGAWRLWRELKASSPSFEFLHGHGLGVLGVGPNQPESLHWLFGAARDGATTAVVREFFATLGGAISARLAEREAAAANERAATAAAAAAESHAALEEQTQTIAHLTGELATARMQLELRQIQAEKLLTAFEGLKRELEERDAELRALDDDRTRLSAALSTQSRLVADLQQLRHRTASAQSAGGSRRDQPTRIENVRQRTDGAVRLGLTALRRVVRTPAALGFIPTRRRGLRRPPVRLFFQPGTVREARAIVAGGLFDEAYYAGQHADVRASRLTPLAHFVVCGAREGRDPHPLFDAAYYLRRNPDVAASGMNPLLHYQGVGAFEGRSPHPLFDAAFYLRNNPDIGGHRIEPLKHFLRFGWNEGRNPNEFFDCAYYLRNNPDVVASGINPLVHFAVDGWRDGRRPSPDFDPAYYLSQNPDVAKSGVNPLTHYLDHGSTEGRRARPDDADGGMEPAPPPAEPALIPLAVQSLGPSTDEPPTVVCMSHVMPCPPRAGNEYRIFRLLCWLRDQGYRIVPVIAPLPGEAVPPEALRQLAAVFTNAVLCDRDGRVEYVLGNVPDVLRSLAGSVTRPASLLLAEPPTTGDAAGDLLQTDRIFCHDVLINTVLQLQQALGPHILLAEYIWMSRVLPLVAPGVLKVIDTHDVFSTKRDKVVRFGIDDHHVEPGEEAERLRRADLVIAIQDHDRRELEQLVPGIPVVTAGVDFDVIDDPGTPTGRRILYVASGNAMNRKGLSDFLRFAWPRVRRDIPDAELMLAGDVGQAILTDVTGVHRLGRVADLAPLYRDARVVINPAVAGTGLKIKTLEALGHFRTVLTFPTGVDGIAPELAALCSVVQDWYAFGRQLCALLATDPPPSFSPGERETIRRFMAPETTYRAMTTALETMARDRSGTAVPPAADAPALQRG